MKSFFYNGGYFLKEVFIILRMNLLSNIFSIFSTGLIFFILAMVISGWWISAEVAEAIQGEAEISIYFDESMDNGAAAKLLVSIQGVEGIREARMVDKSEAYDRMVDILGEDARVLEFFDDNPFSPFIEAQIQLDQMEQVLGRINGLEGVEQVRDNKEVLNRLKDITVGLKILGYLVVAAVGITTLVIISHLIRLGIHHNREQINTLRLLGAPSGFIAFPFLLEGLLLTLLGGILAAVLAVAVLRYLYEQMAGPLPFIPLPPLEDVVPGLMLLMASLSAFLGIAGSLFGISSARER